MTRNSPQTATDRRTSTLLAIENRNLRIDLNVARLLVGPRPAWIEPVWRIQERAYA